MLRILNSPNPAARAMCEQLHQALDGHVHKFTRGVVFAIGGDGTMLRAIRDFWHDDPLFVGLSAGHLGFLQAFEAEQISDVIAALTTTKPLTVSAPLLQVTAGDGQGLGYAFNDVSVERAGPRASRFTLDVNGSTGSFIGDGVIFATAFGSTAYSLAAGGPIIDTRSSDVFVVTPNNPHVSSQYSSLQRPHVLQRGRNVRITIADDDAMERPTQLVLDGHTVDDQLSRPVTIGLSDKTISFLQLKHDSFHARLEAKRLGRS